MNPNPKANSNPNPNLHLEDGGKVKEKSLIVMLDDMLPEASVNQGQA